MGIKAKIGDVFLVPLKDKCWAVGQLVNAWNDELYIAIFDKKVEKKDINPRGVLTQDPVILALTLDAKLFHGNWPILGNVKENLAGFPQPAFKVRQSGIIYMESRDRTVSRPASPQEAGILRYRSISSPAVIEDAIQGLFGISEWNSNFNDLRADYAFESSRLLAKQSSIEI